MPHTPTNTARAAWAKQALAEFISQTSPGDDATSVPRDDLKCAIIDLISDLMHFAHEEQLDAHSIIQLAADHFEAELQESGSP